MPEGSPPSAVRSLEDDVRRLWKNRRLPTAGGLLGPADGPVVHQFEGAFAPDEPPEMVAHRAVAADVDARHLLLAGRGVVGTLRLEPRRQDGAPPRIGPVLESLGVWTGGSSDRPWDEASRQPGVQSIATRLARKGILAARDGPLRLCLSCRTPRSPERIIYQKEVGDTLLVRFPLQGTEPEVDALVWVDAPWRLLGASALLVHPDVPYSVVEYRRKGASALLLTSHGSLARLRSWFPEVELEVKEERPGREWVGRAYSYPLRHEFPIGGSLDPPAGTIQADAEVGDTGTGIVPLVPGHGPTDAEIADRLGIAGWPLLTSRGMLDPTLMHKYAGLDVETASEFVSRDLSESGAVLARLRVVRGVPYCAICGHRMVWTPGRAWCLEPARLPPEQKERYARLLPHERPIGQIEVSRWPVSETSPSTDPESVTLLECARCERLDGPDGPRECPCGGTRRSVSRRLLPSISGAFAAWARSDPLPPADSVRIYSNERRRVPALVHHLTGMSGIDAPGSEFALTLVPTVSRVDLPALLGQHGADAVRSAFVRTAGAGGSTTTFEERCRQEEARLERFFLQAQSLAAQCGPELLRDGAQPPDAAARDLEVEDRAVLARWARAHLKVLASYERGDPEAAHRHLFQFLERDLLRYLEIARSRLVYAGTPATKRGALRTLVYLFRAAATALAPIAPFTAESVHRRLLVEARSLFEGVDLGDDRSLADDELSAAWDRWQAVIEAADDFRRARRLPPGTPLPLVALVLPDEDVAAKLRADRATLERLARISKLEVTSPKVPWTARQRRLVPVESEIQRAYPSLASQIIHLLERMPPRRTAEAAAREVTVFVHGVPRTITPEMVVAVDTLPEGFAPTPYAPGEMYVQPPAGSPGERTPPPLSPDAFWLVRRTRRRLAATGVGGAPEDRVAIVAAIDPLAAELREKSGPIAGYLGLKEFRVIGSAPEAAPHPAVEGRTRTGTRWTVSLPGVPGRRRPAKHRPARSDGRRVPPPAEGAASTEKDFADEQVIAREESIRALGRELDELVAAPLLGPAKVTIAWDAGLRSMQEFREAPFEQVAALAGFGRPVASTLWSKFGRSVPPAPARPARVRGVAPRAQRARPVLAPAVPSPSALAMSPPTELAIPPTPVAPPVRLPAVPERSLPAPATPPVAPAPIEPPVDDSRTAPPEDALPTSVPEPETTVVLVPTPPEVGTGTVPAAQDVPESLAPARASESEEIALPTEEPPEEEPPSSPQEAPGSPAPVEAESGPVAEPPVAPADEAGTGTLPEPPAGDALLGPEGTPSSEAEGTPAAPTESGDVGVPEPTPSEPVLGEAEATAPSIGEVGEDIPPARPMETTTSELPGAPRSESLPEIPARDEIPAESPPGAERSPSPPEEIGSPPARVEESRPPPEVVPVESLPSAESTPESVPETSIGEPAATASPEALPPANLPVESPAPDSTPAGADDQRPAPDGAVAAESTPPTGDAVVPSGTEVIVPYVPDELLVDSAAKIPEPAPSESGTAVPAPAPVEPPAVEPEMPVAAVAIAPRVPEIVGPELSLAAEIPAQPPAVPAPAPPPPVEPPPPPAGVEIDFSSALFLALQPFLDATAAGHKGIALVRELPERIRVHIGPRPVEVYWLTNIQRPRTVRPTDLPALTDRIRQAIDADGVTAIFIEGVEYLVGIHGVERVAEFLREIDEVARQRVARIWIHITPSLIPEAALDRLVAAVDRSSRPIP